MSRGHVRSSTVFAVVSMFSVACGSGDPAPEPPPPLDTRRCKPGQGTTGSPATIAEAVALANALPMPVTAACFVEALDRPLRIEATKSTASAQPAHGARSPRVFIFSNDSLVISVALDGPASHLIEFGEYGPAASGEPEMRRTIKGELPFPLRGPVDDDAPYLQVRNKEHPGVTSCFVCHDHETPVQGRPHATRSDALQPTSASLVSVESLRGAYESCDGNQEPERCAYLEALMGHGAVTHRSFPEALPIF